MATEITILHISDLHARESERQELTLRIKKFFLDVEKQSKQIDCAVFSGDLAYNGKLEELSWARDLLLEPLRKRLRVPAKRTFIIPGNHDVDRAAISFTEETRMATQIPDNATPDSEFIASVTTDQRLSSYHAFAKTYKNTEIAPFYSAVETVRGVKIGFACLNSAWRCSSDNDKGRLFLTSYQVNAASESVEHAHLKIAVLHHPLEWYHPSEQEIVQHDLKRQFDLVLTGHLHLPISVGETTPAHNCIVFTVPALFEGKLRDGYNLYAINYEEKKLTAHYRKFMRVRAEFDKDTEHAPDGSQEFTLPLTEIAAHSKIVLVQRINEVADEMQRRMKEQLQVFQSTDEPVLVTPNIVEIVRKAGVQGTLSGRCKVSDVADQNSIIIGAPESGKTIVLESIVSHLNDVASSAATEELAIYLDFKQQQHRRSLKEIESFVTEEIRKTAPEILALNVSLVADHLDQQDGVQIELLRELADRNGWKLIFALSNNLLVDSVSSSQAFKNFRYFELTAWGPSRIREFIIRLFHGTELDVDAAYNFITNSLRDTDLPATPVVVALYLSVFPTVGEQISSLSFLRLLEKIEQVRLDSQELSSSYSLYNKRELLISLATACERSNSIGIPRAEFERTIRDFFSDKLLQVDVSKFLRILEESKIVKISDSQIEFSYYVFHDYYLARALQKGVVKIDEKIKTLEDCIRLSQTLSFYGGLFREDSEIIEKILTFMTEKFGEMASFTMKDLDTYISDVLHPRDAKKTAEAAAAEHAAEKVDYEAQDSEFAESREKYRERREGMAKIEPPKDEMQLMLMQISSLKTFYNLFRNLENLSGENKITLLDRILDFHIKCNVDLIGFFDQLFDDKSFKTFNAYFLTVTGQRFLSANVGNQSLQAAILEALKRCTNDFKELLLTNLYADLRLPDYLGRLEVYLGKTNSPAAIEIVFNKARTLLIEHEEPEIPNRLIQLFKSAFEKRQLLYGGKESKGTFNQAVQEAIASRSVLWAN